MNEEELHCLRAVNQRLEHEVQTMMGWNRRLEKELTASREQFEGERVLVKCLKKEIESEVKLAKETLTKKYERSLAELKMRLQLEQSQSLELQKLQLEREFRSDLMKCIHKKDSQLHLLFIHSRQVQREADQKRTAERQRYHSSYEMYLQQLKQDFKRQLTRLLLELKSKERKIGELERSLVTQITPPVSPTLHTQSGLHVCRRNKSYYRRSGSTHHPYSTDARKKRYETIMKETDDLQHDDDSHSHQLYVLHHQYGAFPLETLPEVSEDESKPEESNLSPSSLYHKSIITAKTTNNGNNALFVKDAENNALGVHNPETCSCRCESQSSDEFEMDGENEHEKVMVLEATIRQLQDELRESKEQSELLEFRLLELEEFESPSNRVTDERGNVSIVGKSRVEELLRSSEGVVLCGAEIPSEVTNNGDYESSNSHSSVAESRSSCSDCSESLSLQESGIFENQFSEDQTGTTSRSEEVGRELATLASQIESLVLSFGDESGIRGESCSKSEISTTSLKREGRMNGNARSGRTGQQQQHPDFPSELKYCRQRIQQFEKRLAKFTDITYMSSLEAKVNLLIQENRRLEEERAELEEAENDSRHQFQRLEEKVKEVRGKNTLLQQQLSNEKKYIEQLRIQILQLQEGEEELCTQLSRVESLAQNYEQRNFELEESQIEIKYTVQVILHSLPLLILWNLWHDRRHQQQSWKSTTLPALLDHNPSMGFYFALAPPLPTTTPPPSRKHKLKNEMTVTMIEPQFKKLRSEKEKFLCTLCQRVVADSGVIVGTIPSTKSTQVAVVVADVGSQTTLLECETYAKAKAEEFYKSRITELECEINRHQESYVSEKQRLIQMHGVEIAENLAKCRRNEIEKAALEERWDCLIKQLEQFAASVALNLNEGPWASNKKQRDEVCNSGGSSKINTSGTSTFGIVSSGQLSPPPLEIKGVQIKGESLVANRIRSLFPDEWLCRGKVVGRSNNSSAATTKCTLPEPQSNSTSSSYSSSSLQSRVSNPSELIARLEERFEESRKREKVLLNEIDRLKSDLEEKVSWDQQLLQQQEQRNCGEWSHMNNKEIIHLSEENNRLQMMLSEQETAWLSVKELEDENEKLVAELTSNATLQRRLEDVLATEKKLRHRVEELEHSEINSKETLEEKEKKGKKTMDALHLKLNFLSEEVEFLRSKSAQLQDTLAVKVERETKLRLDIQLLTSKLELSATALEEREQFLESTEATLRSQISKLREELNDVYQQLADSECSNGMLSEEIEALERALHEAMEITNKHEVQVKILKSELESREDVLMDLQQELLLMKQGAGHGSGCPNPNDLDVFARNEGGLIGVTREVNDIMEIVESCNRCNNAVNKLTEVSKQLNTLTLLMLGGSQRDCCNCPSEGEQVENLLTRCESEEHLLNPTSVTKSGQAEELCLKLDKIVEENLSLQSHIGQLESDLTVKEKEVQCLSENIVGLRTQLSDSTQAYISRENDLKECHLNEGWWWKWRCQEKNDLIQLLAKRLAHLSATDMHDYFLDGILREIRQLRDSNYPPAVATSTNPVQANAECPQDCDSLLSFINAERKRIMDLLKSTCDDFESQPEGQLYTGPTVSTSPLSSVDFRVLRRIGDESLLVSWTIPEIPKGKLDGYEISVNGNMFLRIRQPSRYKALLFGLDMSEPLHLTLKCTGAFRSQESSITYIA